jgi:oxygen-independent coproporphyrinogen-3 oxidase
MINIGKKEQLNENQGAVQFGMMVDFLAQNGFEQYEISNFAKNQRYAIHNTSYWQGNSYLGIGPSAHSFKSTQRSWNIANNSKYILSLSNNVLPSESETLSQADLFNEAIMTGLRTKWGVRREKLASINNDFLLKFEISVVKYISADQMKFTNGAYILSNTGKIIADRIASELFEVA